MSRPTRNARESDWIRAELRSVDQPMHGFPMICIDCLKPTTSRKMITALRDRARRYPLPRDFHTFDLPLCTRCRLREKTQSRRAILTLVFLLPFAAIATVVAGYAMHWRVQLVQDAIIVMVFAWAGPMALVAAYSNRVDGRIGWRRVRPAVSPDGKPQLELWFRNRAFAQTWVDSWIEPIEIPTHSPD